MKHVYIFKSFISSHIINVNATSFSNDLMFNCRMVQFLGLEDYYEVRHQAPKIASGEVNLKMQ